MSALICQLRDALEKARPHVVWAATSDPFSPDAPFAVGVVDTAIRAADKALKGEHVPVMASRHRFDCWYAAWGGFGVGVTVTVVLGFGLLFGGACQ